MRKWANVAVLAKAKNLEGGFVARSVANLPFLLEVGMELALVPPVLDAPRRVHIQEIQPQHNGTYYLFFNEVTTRATAEALAGCHCLVKRELLNDNQLLLVTPDLAGWRVIDRAAGFTGTISEVIENPGQYLLEINEDESCRTVYVPFVEQFIASIDEQAQQIELCAPSGLYDLQ